MLLLTDVTPALGVVTAILLFFSPLAAARKAVAQGSLGVGCCSAAWILAFECCVQFLRHVIVSGA